jgi:hypothetical protein
LLAPNVRTPRPQSARHSWSSRFFVYEKVRIGDEKSRISQCDKFLNVFAREGCKMVEMSCTEYNKHAAGSQFITHTVGRVLEMLSEKRGREGARCGCRGKGEDRSEMREKKLKE